MLNYEKFKEIFKRKLEALFKEECPGWTLTDDVRFSINRKICSVRAVPPGEGEGSVLPSFRYDDLYSSYAAGTTIPAMAEGILRSVLFFAENPPDIEAPSDAFEEEPDELGFIIINKTMNTELLKTHPHVDFLDLAIVFKVISRSSEEAELSALVTEEMAEEMGLSAEEMLEKACDTMFEKYPVVAEEKDGAFILSAENSPFVTHALADTGLLSALAEETEGDLYVMPLTLRMIAVFPAGDFPLEELKTTAEKMFKFSSLEDRLSRHVYLYSRAEELLTVCR